MAKIVVITDTNGRLLGAVRSEPFRTSDGKLLRFVAHPRHKHYPMEVDARTLCLPASEVGKFLRDKLREVKEAEEPRI